jgi:hypothetical protein
VLEISGNDIGEMKMEEFSKVKIKNMKKILIKE